MVLIAFAHLTQFTFNFFYWGCHSVAERLLWFWTLWFVIRSFLECWVLLWNNWVLIVWIFLSSYFRVIHNDPFQIRNRWLVNHFVNRDFFLRFHRLLSQVLLFSVWHTSCSWNFENWNHRYALFNFGAVDLHVIAALKPFLLDQGFLSLIHLPATASFSKINIGLLYTFFPIHFYQLWIVCVNFLALSSNCRKSFVIFLYIILHWWWPILCFYSIPVEISFNLSPSSWPWHSPNCFCILWWNLTHLSFRRCEHLNILRMVSNSCVSFSLCLRVLWMLIKCYFLRAVLWPTSLKASALELYRMGIFSIISHVFLIFSR